MPTCSGTGAPVPAGADAVIRVEDTRAVTDDQIEFRLPVGAGNDIRRRGEGMQEGQELGNEMEPGHEQTEPPAHT